MKDSNVLMDYSEIEMSFYEYRRFFFYFQGKGEKGEHILARVGTGESFPIYKFTFNVNEPQKLKDLPISSLSVRQDGELIGEYYK